MSQAWQPIYLSAKVFGHLAQGLYRTPAGAIKELISNSFDADATLVRIHTGFPRFETFSCEDNGTGMSRDEFQRLMNRGIGSSYKRSSSALVTEVYKRPLIGRLGLGILSLAQICTRFEILSHHSGTETAFRATIQFPPYTRKEMDKIAKRLSDDNDDEQIHGGNIRSAKNTTTQPSTVCAYSPSIFASPFVNECVHFSILQTKRHLGQASPIKHLTLSSMPFTVPQSACSLSIFFPTMTSYCSGLPWLRPCLSSRIAMWLSRYP